MTEGYAIDTDRPPELILPADLRMAKAIATVLQTHYPDHPWGATADHKNGVAVIRNWGLGQNWGFIIKLDDLSTDPTMKSVVKAGGELLERFNIHRAKARSEDYATHPFFRTPDA